MPTQLSKGHVFVPGEVVDPADLNELVDNGEVLKGAITEATLAAPNTPASDLVLYYNNTAGDLRKCHVSQLPSGVTSVAMTVAPTTVFKTPGPTITTTGTFNVELKDQAKNKVLAGPATGTAVAPSFRTLESVDITLPTVTIFANNIDWSLGNVFTKTLPTGAVTNTFSFTNVDDGQAIKVRFKQNAAGNARVDWNPGSLTLFWAGGVEPELPTVPDGFGIYVFTAVTDISSGIMRIHGYMENSGGVIGLGNQAANKFLAGPVSGAATEPTFRLLSPSDLPVATVNIALNLIDWNLGNCFSKLLTANANFTFSNASDGQIITVFLHQDATGGRTVNWPIGAGGVYWPGGTAPVQTPGLGRRDIYTIRYLDGIYFGTVEQDFLSI